MDVIFFGYFSAQWMAAGLAGGMIHAINTEKATSGQVAVYMITGCAVSNFFGPSVLKLLTIVLPQILLPLPEGAVAFAVGYCGKVICLYIELAFKSWNPLGKIKNE